MVIQTRLDLEKKKKLSPASAEKSKVCPRMERVKNKCGLTWKVEDQAQLGMAKVS